MISLLGHIIKTESLKDDLLTRAGKKSLLLVPGRMVGHYNKITNAILGAMAVTESYLMVIAL